MGQPLIFGSGSLYGVNAAGGAIKLGTLQDVSFDFSANSKPLHGQKQIAEEIMRGNMKITGKAKAARFNGKLVNELFFGATASVAVGQLLLAEAEAGAIPAVAGPYTVTVTHSATFDTDLGVTLADGTVLTKVASAPATGEYSVSAGVYTFAAADTGKAVLIDYLYTTSAGGTIATLTSQTMGTTPKFKGVFSVTVLGKTSTLVLNSCTSNKFTFATKQEDYAIPEFDFEAMSDSVLGVGRLSLAN